MTRAKGNVTNFLKLELPKYINYNPKSLIDYLLIILPKCESSKDLREFLFSRLEEFLGENTYELIDALLTHCRTQEIDLCSLVFVSEHASSVNKVETPDFAASAPSPDFDYIDLAEKTAGKKTKTHSLQEAAALSSLCLTHVPLFLNRPSRLLGPLARYGAVLDLRCTPAKSTAFVKFATNGAAACAATRFLSDNNIFSEHGVRVHVARYEPKVFVHKQEFFAKQREELEEKRVRVAEREKKREVEQAKTVEELKLMAIYDKVASYKVLLQNLLGKSSEEVAQVKQRVMQNLLLMKKRIEECKTNIVAYSEKLLQM